MLTDFTKLEAWKQSMDLAVKVHRITKEFPKEELYGVTAQMRRSSLSVAANIAEGFGRYTFADKMHKYVQARGELIELMTHSHYCFRVGYLPMKQRDDLLSDAQSVHRMLNALISKMSSLNGSPKS